MTWIWGDLWGKSQKWLKAGWLITAGLVAIYIGAIEPAQIAQELEGQRSGGLGAVAGPVTIIPSRRAKLMTRLESYSPSTSGDFIGQTHAASMSINGSTPPTNSESAEEDRKLVRTGSMQLVVKSPVEAAENIRQLVERMGGYLESSQVNGTQAMASAFIAIRVPVARFEEVRTEIRKLGLRVDSDQLEAHDVTRDYVDREARLRNLRAQEQQYLAIMKRATTVKDTLEVSEKLNEVRGAIEQQQAEFNALSKQVETVAITVSLNAEADAQVFGLHWRPLLRLKIAARDGLDGVADYLATMTSLVFYLPSILLWLGTILIGAAAGWRILRWAARVFFAFPQQVAIEKGAN